MWLFQRSRRGSAASFAPNLCSSVLFILNQMMAPALRYERRGRCAKPVVGLVRRVFCPLSALILMWAAVLPSNTFAAGGFPAWLPTQPSKESLPNVPPLSPAAIDAARADEQLQIGYRLMTDRQHGSDGARDFRAAAVFGNPIAEAVNCALDWQSQDDMAEMAALLTDCHAAAERGYAPAQLILGLVLEGPGPQAKAEEAVHWLRLAAMQGDAMARGIAW
ncbi:MAG: hypothetical protein ABWY00_03125 [Dongiaceae bacterium]